MSTLPSAPDPDPDLLAALEREFNPAYPFLRAQARTAALVAQELYRRDPTSPRLLVLVGATLALARHFNAVPGPEDETPA